MTSPDDPLHERSDPGVRWTTNNFAEAIPGVPTPLSWSIWKHAMSEAAIENFRRLGVFTAAEARALRVPGAEPVVSIFFGHVAGNIDFMSRASAHLPGIDPGAFEHQLFGLDPDASPIKASKSRWPAIAVRAPVALVGQRRRLDDARRAAEDWWRASVAGPLDVGAARAVLCEAADRFATVLAIHSFQSQLAQGAFDQVARMSAKAGHPGLERRLVSGYGGLEEAAVAADLWSLSRGTFSLDAFLDRHGFHGPNEGELSSRSWREDPEPVRRAAKAYAEMDDGLSPAAAARRQAADREQAERMVLASKGSWAAPAVKVTLRMARGAVPRREVGKAGFLMVVDAARAAARVLGEDLRDRGVLSDRDDVFFLTVAEVLDPPRAADEVARARRARRSEYQRVRLPAVWTGEPEPQPVAPRAESMMVTGTPVSPGVTEGRARLVLDPADCDSPVGPDEVLVTPTTDPSWVSLFLTAGALVIDIGGPMSHGAIVARELGIPCVIGTLVGTASIRDGALVRVDGDAGTVELLDGDGGQPRP